ncbi:isochorismatase family protein [Peptoniphilus sp. GNH]|nr:isochorismatase family protein [Clostridiales bacterium KA00134]UHR02890.1 isochorismatase family protein [Peptoniphilus sp. GNH]
MNKFELNRDNCLILFLDLQKKLNPAMYESEKMLKNAEILANLVEIFGLDAIQTTQYKKGLGDNEDFIVNKNIQSIDKNSFSCMGDENFRNLIKKYKDKTIVITGAETHICVFQTVRDLLSEGFNVQLVSDAVGSRTKENRENGIELIRQMGCVITNTETVLFDLAKKAGSPEFKKAQALIL